jgi:hypothetical protein
MLVLERISGVGIRDGSHHNASDTAYKAGHSMEVVDATGVVNALFFQPQ